MKGYIWKGETETWGHCLHDYLSEEPHANLAKDKEQAKWNAKRYLSEPVKDKFADILEVRLTKNQVKVKKVGRVKK